MSSSPVRRRVLIVFNPTAGSRRQSRLRGIVEALIDAGAEVKVRDTTGPYDATHVTSECTMADWDAVAAAGGDGTLNEVINGHHAGVPPVALIPLGTGNLAALEMGIGSNPAAIARMIVEGPVRPAYAARVNDRRFLLMTGVGFDAQVVRDVSSPMKRMVGKGAYAFETLRQMVRYGFPNFDVKIDGVTHRAASMIAMKGHFYAGPYVCASGATFDTPSLHACLFENPGRFHVLRYGANMLLGCLESCSGYRVLPAQRIVIESPEDAPVQVDGDRGGNLPVVIEATAEPVPMIRMPAVA